jgi:sugar phosphate permease
LRDVRQSSYAIGAPQPTDIPAVMLLGYLAMMLFRRLMVSSIPTFDKRTGWKNRKQLGAKLSCLVITHAERLTAACTSDDLDPSAF